MAAGRRVVRGGSFVNRRNFVRAAGRDRLDPDRLDTDGRGNFVGFRVMAPGS